MTDLDVLSIARVEYREATNWYLDQSVSAAERFIVEVEAAFDSIQRHPTQYPRWDDRYRYLLLRKFPYYVAYHIEPDSIVVVAVFHTSRDPSAWTGR